MSNIETLRQAGLLVKQMVDIDLGEFAEQYKGTRLQVWVNAPAILDDWITRAEEKETDLNTRREVVKRLFELNDEAMRLLDDVLMLWLYGKGVAAYNEFHATLRKNSEGG